MNETEIEIEIGIEMMMITRDLESDQTNIRTIGTLHDVAKTILLLVAGKTTMMTKMTMMLHPDVAKIMMIEVIAPRSGIPPVEGDMTTNMMIHHHDVQTETSSPRVAETKMTTTVIAIAIGLVTETGTETAIVIDTTPLVDLGQSDPTVTIEIVGTNLTMTEHLVGTEIVTDTETTKIGIGTVIAVAARKRRES